MTALEGEKIEQFREKIHVETTVGCLDWFATMIATAKRENKGLEDLESEVEKFKGQVFEELLSPVLCTEINKLVMIDWPPKAQP